jgi:hypothetical protein
LRSSSDSRRRKAFPSAAISPFFLTIFLLALAGQAIAGHNLYNEEQLAHQESPISLWRYLRQRGSPESKPVGAPSEGATGEEG